MKQIYKYSLGYNGTVLSLPKGAQVLTVRFQNSGYGQGFKLWALVDITASQEHQSFLILPTGAPVTKDVHYISSIELDGGEMVHVFRVNE